MFIKTTLLFIMIFFVTSLRIVKGEAVEEVEDVEELVEVEEESSDTDYYTLSNLLSQSNPLFSFISPSDTSDSTNTTEGEHLT